MLSALPEAADGPRPSQTRPRGKTAIFTLYYAQHVSAGVAPCRGCVAVTVWCRRCVTWI